VCPDGLEPAAADALRGGDVEVRLVDVLAAMAADLRLTLARSQRDTAR